MYMAAIRTKYKDSDLKAILDYLGKLTDARNKLNGMSDEVFMVHVNCRMTTQHRAKRLHQARHEHRQHQARPTNTVFGQQLLVQSSKTNIMGQVCGGNNHTYNTCPGVPDKKKEAIKEYRD